MMRGSLTMETFDATTFPSNHNNDAWSPDKRSDEVFLGSCIWRDWEPSRDAEEAEPENHWNNFSSMSGWCRNLIKGDVNLVNVWEWWMLQFVKRMSVWWMLPIVILFEKSVRHGSITRWWRGGGGEGPRDKEDDEKCGGGIGGDGVGSKEFPEDKLIDIWFNYDIFTGFDYLE